MVEVHTNKIFPDAVGKRIFRNKSSYRGVLNRKRAVLYHRVVELLVNIAVESYRGERVGVARHIVDTAHVTVVCQSDVHARRPDVEPGPAVKSAAAYFNVGRAAVIFISELVGKQFTRDVYNVSKALEFGIDYLGSAVLLIGKIYASAAVACVIPVVFVIVAEINFTVFNAQNRACCIGTEVAYAACVYGGIA